MTDAVFFLPGVIAPASIAFRDLADELPGDFDVILKDLALYDDAAPPPQYTLESEVRSLLAAADRAGRRRFHLVGYSAGGAVAALAAATHPDRLLSLVLMEPSWLGNDDVPESERRVSEALRAVDRLPPDKRIAAWPEQHGSVRIDCGPGPRAVRRFHGQGLCGSPPSRPGASSRAGKSGACAGRFLEACSMSRT